MEKIKDNSSLVKDERTNTVINTNKNGYNQFKAAQSRIRFEQKEKDELKNRVEKIESMLYDLINKEK